MTVLVTHQHPLSITITSTASRDLSVMRPVPSGVLSEEGEEARAFILELRAVRCL